MSSLRNAVSRRAHKERAQPESKIKFGLLEKHKDYVERAKAYHKKEETLRKTEKLTATLHSLDNWPSSRYVYFAEDRKEAREIQTPPKSGKMPVSEDIPDRIKRKTAGSYRELEGRRKRVNEMEKIYMDMAMQKELQKKGKNPQTM